MAIQRAIDIQDARFEIMRELGRGSATRVLLAYDRSKQRHVALKILARHLASDPESCFGHSDDCEALILDNT